MKLTDIEERDYETINKMYDEFVKRTDYKEDCTTFINDYLDRCECCHEITYYDELQDCENWNGKHYNCCEECQDVMRDE